ELHQRTARWEGRVGHEDVEGTRFVHAARHASSVRQVRHHDPCPDRVRERPERVGAPPGHHHGRAGRMEGSRDGLSDPAVRARHERPRFLRDLHAGAGRPPRQDNQPRLIEPRGLPFGTATLSKFRLLERRRREEATMKLYEFPPTRSIRPRWMLQELEVPFESVWVNLIKGEHRDREFLKLNPAGKVPVLVDGDLVLNESVAIVLYLAEKYPDKGFLP